MYTTSICTSFNMYVDSFFWLINTIEQGLSFFCLFTQQYASHSWYTSYNWKFRKIRGNLKYYLGAPFYVRFVHKNLALWDALTQTVELEGYNTFKNKDLYLTMGLESDRRSFKESRKPWSSTSWELMSWSLATQTAAVLRT